LSREIFLCSELLPYLLTLGIEKKHKKNIPFSEKSKNVYKNIFGKMGKRRLFYTVIQLISNTAKLMN
jgi:hypothetical protein